MNNTVWSECAILQFGISGYKIFSFTAVSRMNTSVIVQSGDINWILQHIYSTIYDGK